MNFESEGVLDIYYVYERYGLREFLKEVAQLFEVWVFTAATKEYADAILLKLDPEGSIFSKRLYRQNCVTDESGKLVKDLTVVAGDELAQAVLVDDDPDNVEHNWYNSIQIRKFGPDLGADTELSRVFETLKELAEVDNI